MAELENNANNDISEAGSAPAETLVNEGAAASAGDDYLPIPEATADAENPVEPTSDVPDESKTDEG
ncbi:MAG: hypothetical protein HQK96_19580 [Nitrospirae bacterium]|nr:hypothetical protein [Nitrospirota bacterium]